MHNLVATLVLLFPVRLMLLWVTNTLECYSTTHTVVPRNLFMALCDVIVWTMYSFAFMNRTIFMFVVTCLCYMLHTSVKFLQLPVHPLPIATAASSRGEASCLNSCWREGVVTSLIHRTLWTVRAGTGGPEALILLICGKTVYSAIGAMSGSTLRNDYDERSGWNCCLMSALEILWKKIN